MDGGSLPPGHIVKIQERSEFIAAPVHGITFLSVERQAGKRRYLGDSCEAEAQPEEDALYHNIYNN